MSRSAEPGGGSVMMYWLLAQEGVEHLGGQAGWVGAALLGAVRAWLMFVYLPAKDKAITQMSDARDRHVSALLERFIDATEKRDGRFDQMRKELMESVVSITGSLSRAVQSIARVADHRPGGAED